jgi:uncharacterized surface protein with fasciclin (FAS1) repeats
MFVKFSRLFVLALAITAVTLSTVRAEEADKAGDIVDVAVGAKFTKLVAAVKAAGLVDTLKGKGPFTVFAPTDKAFEALGEEKLNALLKDKETLKKILTYHVIAGKVDAKAATKVAKAGDSAKTVEGSEIKFSLDGKNIKLNGTAKVIKADVAASNGVIHVIDAVIVPLTK